jgi:nuclear transport factor 2 (NTF2) superfamily protein
MMENWEFGEHGLMRRCIASTNDLPIQAQDRVRCPWNARPNVYPGLPDLDL